MTKTNNVIRLLEKRKIPHQVYILPPEKIGAEKTARILNVPLAKIFKTIVLMPEKPGKPILAVVPGDTEVNLKSVASVLNQKKVSLPTEREAEKLTGLQAGGISPLALINRRFQVLIDESVNLLPELHISGGERGLNIRLPVAAFIELTNALTAAIAKRN